MNGYLLSYRVRILAVAHLFLGLGCVALAGLGRGMPVDWELVPAIPHLAMVVSQACLLAIWAVMGANRKALRLLGFLAGVFYLEVVMYLGTQDDDFTWLATFSGISVAAVLLASRIWFAPLAKLGASAAGSGLRTFQFSIKSLMILTACVAVFVTAAKAVNAYVGGPAFLVELLLWTASVAMTGLASTWATLTAANPARRAALVVLLAIVSAAGVAYGFNEGWPAYFYLITITALQAAIVLASLLVVRSSGYRLVARWRRTVESAGLVAKTANESGS